MFSLNAPLAGSLGNCAKTAQNMICYLTCSYALTMHISKTGPNNNIYIICIL